MNGMILAAGLGTRLRPLTLERPKAVVPVANLPAAAWAAGALSAASIRDVAVNLHHLPDRVQEALGDGSELGIDIVYSHEHERILGTGGGTRRALDLLDPGPLVVVNGDVVSDVDLAELLESHERAGAPVTLALVPRPDHARYGTVTARDGLVTSIVGRRARTHPEPSPDEAPLVFAGIHVMGPEAQRLLPASGCVVRETFFSMLEKGLPIAAHVHEGFWSDIGTPAEYLGCNLDILGGRAGRLAPRARVEDSRLIGENVVIGDGARIGRDVILGDDVRVEDGADLEGCVVWDGAAASGRLRNAIVSRGHVLGLEENA
ncbi:MAG: NDP-sugar synthase [Deltaproteobacteria bacterium]|nr:NDP-sugar synthase [Deltaproteobacteria bacterium]